MCIYAFISVIIVYVFLQLGSLKFDLQLTNCFRPILSFNDFYPLHTQLISLNITCENFHLDQPSDAQIRTAIFLTPTLIINTRAQSCPLIHQYQWLNLRHSQALLFTLRTLICEDRVIQLHWSIDRTTTMTITIARTDLLNEISLPSPTISSKWPTLILINFSVVLLSILMITFAVLIRFLKYKSTI